MSQNNSNNDSEQENHRQPQFIPPVVNSDNGKVRTEGGKAGDSPEEPAEKIVGKINVAKPSPRRKLLKQKRKSRKRRQSTSSSSDSEEIERKRRIKKSSGRKRERKSPSSSSIVSSSDFTKDSDPDALATDKRFKLILKAEKFKWNLPSSMAEYANNHFNSYIPNKDIEEQLLTENPVSSNLQLVKPLDDFIRSLLFSQTVTT